MQERVLPVSSIELHSLGLRRADRTAEATALEELRAHFEAYAFADLLRRRPFAPKPGAGFVASAVSLASMQVLLRSLAATRLLSSRVRGRPQKVYCVCALTTRSFAAW